MDVPDSEREDKAVQLLGIMDEKGEVQDFDSDFFEEEAQSVESLEAGESLSQEIRESDSADSVSPTSDLLRQDIANVEEDSDANDSSATDGGNGIYGQSEADPSADSRQDVPVNVNTGTGAAARNLTKSLSENGTGTS